MQCLGSELRGGAWPPFITACSSSYHYYCYHHLIRFQQEQIALALPLECAPQCGVEEEDGSAEEEAEAAAEEEYE